MPAVNIIAKDSRGGLGRDISLLSGLLQQRGVQVTVTQTGAPRVSRGALRFISKHARHVRSVLGARYHAHPSRQYDLNLFLEDIKPVWLPCARRNALLPNQEWVRPKHRPCLSSLDAVLCKTLHGRVIFQKPGCLTEYVSFTCLDRFDPAVPRRLDGVLHLAGDSPMKGTRAVTDLWRAHPEWPRLTVVQSLPGVPKLALPNVDHITARLDDGELRRLQNAHAIHLCPSEAEGFGFSIAEALSAGAVTVVTDAPPMNELAAPGRALMVACSASEPMGLGARYQVDSRALEQKVAEALAMPADERQRMGANARAWYIENDAFFRRRFTEVMSGLVSASA